eukprot:gb/GEZN01000126.1/.p1 GENE.gb/GEZN01000126.1/~~gb/GEZN01000126.1/.p1  ORF type:complete len:2104 (+),score=242.22 gb/GEZN01000126.1/:60-6371(+)
MFLLVATLCGFPLSCASNFVVNDGQLIYTTLSESPNHQAYLRFAPSWLDVVEGALDWALDRGYQHFILNQQNNSILEVGFNLSLANHNLFPSRSSFLSSAPAWQRGMTLELVSGSSLFIQSSLSSSQCDQLVLVLGPDHVDCSQLVVSQSNNFSVFCTSPLPFPAPGHLTISEVVAAEADKLWKLLNESNDSSVWQEQQLVLYLADPTNPSDTHALPVGPLFYDASACPSTWCLQASRTTFIFDMAEGALVGQGSSSRGFCGAPTTLLPSSLRSIVIGQSCALTGQTSALGIGMRDGLAKGLLEAWRTPSWSRGRVILYSLDDSYEPLPAQTNTYEMVERLKVAMLAGYVGTATTAQIFDYLQETQIPYICPLTGGRFLRAPAVPSIINIRASYDDEVEAIVQYLSMFSRRRIALFFQNDGYGEAGKIALELALSKRGLSIYTSGTYPPNTLAIEQGLADMLAAPLVPDAVVMVGLADPLSKFICAVTEPQSPVSASAALWAKEATVGSLAFFGVSPTGTIKLMTRLQELGVVPHPAGILPSNIFISEVLSPTKGWDPIESEGYICGQFIGSLLTWMGSKADLSPENIIQALHKAALFQTNLANTSLLLGPFSPDCNQGLRDVFMTSITPNFETKLEMTLRVDGCGVSLNPSIAIPPIVFGQSGPLSGSNRELGVDMRAGIIAAFDKVNRQGGVGGRWLQLLSLDDGYEPSRTVNNTRALIEEFHVFGLLGMVGTATISAVLDYVLAKKIPIIGSFTGAKMFREPFQAEIVNMRASYDDEMYVITKFCLAHGRELISIFFQDDSFGAAGLTALQTQLANEGITILSNASYERNTENVEEGLAKLQDPSLPVPQAVVLVGTARPLAKFIALASPNWPDDLLFFTLSFVGAEVFATELLGSSPTTIDRIYVSQVVPSPFEPSVLTKDFINDLAATCPTCRPSFTAFEGYICGILTHSILLRMNLDHDADRFELAALPVLRSDFLKALYSTSRFKVGHVFLGPFADTCQTDTAVGEINCLEPCNQGARSVSLTLIRPTPANATELGFVARAFPNFSYTTDLEWITVWEGCNRHTNILPERERPLVLVQSAVLSGDSDFLGLEIRRGWRAAIAYFNAQPGRSRYINLLTYDDGYDPARTTINVRHALARQNFVAFVGFTGTATSMAVLSEVLDNGYPFVAPFTGARDLRTPFYPEVVNVRPGYDEEVASHVRHLVARQRTRISLFSQADAGGAAGRKALQLALNFWHMKIFSEGEYVRNTRDVQAGLCNMFSAPADCSVTQLDSTLSPEDRPEAVVMIGTAYALSDMMTLAAKSLPSWKPDFYTISFVGAANFVQELRRQEFSGMDRVFVSLVVPPEKSKKHLALFEKFKTAMSFLESELQAEMTLESLEGFIGGSLLTHAIAETQSVTPQTVLSQIYRSQIFDVEEIEMGPFLNTSLDSCNEGMKTVYLVRVADPSDDLEVVDMFHIPASQCGVYAAYSDGPCPEGTIKTYLFPAQNLSFECRLPVPREIEDVTISPKLNLSIQVIGGILVGVTFCVMVVLARFRNHPILKISSVVFRGVILVGIVLIQSTLFVITKHSTDATCSAFTWLLQMGFAISMGNMTLITFRVYQIMSFASRKKFTRAHIPNSYLFIASAIIVFLNCCVLGLMQYMDPPRVVLEVEGYIRYKRCRQSATFFPIIIMADALVLMIACLLAYRMSKVLLNRYKEASDLREVTLASYNISVLTVILLPIIALLHGNPDLEQILLSSFSAFMSITLLGSIFGRRFFILRTYPDPDEYLKNKEKSGASTSAESDIFVYNNMPDAELLAMIQASSPEELMLRLRHRVKASDRSLVLSGVVGPSIQESSALGHKGAAGLKRKVHSPQLDVNSNIKSHVSNVSALDEVGESHFSRGEESAASEVEKDMKIDFDFPDDDDDKFVAKYDDLKARSLLSKSQDTPRTMAMFAEIGNSLPHQNVSENGVSDVLRSLSDSKLTRSENSVHPKAYPRTSEGLETDPPVRRAFIKAMRTSNPDLQSTAIHSNGSPRSSLVLHNVTTIRGSSSATNLGSTRSSKAAFKSSRATSFPRNSLSTTQAELSSSQEASHVPKDPTFVQELVQGDEEMELA